MSTRARVDAFEAWLRSAGTPAEVALFTRSIAEGFVAVAGAREVTAAHVELSCQLARDAGMDVSAMEQLGAMFVRYERERRDAPVAVHAEAAPAVVAEAAEAAPAVAPAPLVVLFRGATAAEPESVAEAKTEPEAEAEAAPDSPPPRRRHPDAASRAKRIAAAAVVAVGVLVAWLAHDPSSAAPDSAEDRSRRLAQLGLDATLPDGWRVAPEVQPLGALQAALVSRGGSAGDPDDRAFIATLPLTESLADGPAISDDDLLRATQRAERGTASRLAADGGTYLTGGCQLAAIGARTAVCRGTVHDGGRTLALQTYLRVGDERAVVALFVAKLSVADPAHEADAVIQSLGI